MRFGLWRALVSLPSHIIVFSTMIYDRSDRAFVFPSNFFFPFLAHRRTALDSDAAMRRGTSSATPRNFRSRRLFSRHSKGQYFFVGYKAINDISNLKRKKKIYIYLICSFQFIECKATDNMSNLKRHMNFNFLCFKHLYSCYLFAPLILQNNQISLRYSLFYIQTHCFFFNFKTFTLTSVLISFYNTE